jgi:hypothetical protein
MFMCIYVCVYVCTCIHTYIHTYDTYIHTYIHTSHTQAGIIYSYDVATASSIIPAFLKRGDLVIRDEAIWSLTKLTKLTKLALYQPFSRVGISSLDR